MRLAALEIRNFRGIREGSIRFGPHTVLLGAGNVGKTTIIEALALLLGRDRLIRELTEHDFTGSCPGPRDRIELVATITDFPTQEHTDHPEWFRDGRGIPKYLDAQTGDLHPMRDETATWRLACQIGFQARFDDEALTVETVRYFHDRDGSFDAFDDEAYVTPIPPRLIGELGFFLIRAARTWDGMISFGSELFRRIISSMKGQPASAVLMERDRLRRPKAPIEADPRLKPLIERIDAELARLIPSSPRLKLRISSTDSRGVLDAVVAHFGREEGTAVPVNRQGTGLISLQGLLLLLELARTRVEAGGSFILAVEEPEIHVPPPSQARLLRRIQALSPQSILTTHAAAIAAAADPTAVLVLRNEAGSLVPEPLLRHPLNENSPNNERRYFLDLRHLVVAALMHDAVLVPEGRGEADLLGALSQALDARQPWGEDAKPSFSLEVGVIPTHQSSVQSTVRIFRRLHPRLSCLLDGDDEGDRFIREIRADGLPAGQIIRWPTGWDLESGAEWIVDADAASVCAKLAHLARPPKTAADVAAELRAHKADVVLYEAVAAAIAETPASAVHARELLSALALACKGEATARFRPDDAGLLVFTP